MGQSKVNNLIHLIYSTKHRALSIPANVGENLYAYQAGIFKAYDSPAIVIGGVEDHAHALFALSKNVALKDIVEEVKKGSSKWMKTKDGSGNPDFTWLSFQDELRILFDRHEIEFDERYVWD